MLLVIDANILVGELMRERGQRLITHPTLDLLIADRAWDETQHELPRRLQIIEKQGKIEAGTVNLVLAHAISVIAFHVRRVPLEQYQSYFAQARMRIPQDLDDVPTVALALCYSAGIWTNDRDFFGCGLPTWTTKTLLSYVTEEESG